MKKMLFFLSCLFLATLTFAQSNTRSLLSNQEELRLQGFFREYETFTMSNMAGLWQQAQSETGTLETTLQMGAQSFDFVLKEYEWRGQNYVSRYVDENGIHFNQQLEDIKTYKGHLANRPDVTVAFTLTPQTIYGMVDFGEDVFHFEPVHYIIDQANRAAFVGYWQTSVVPSEGNTCGAIEIEKKAEQFRQETPRELENINGIACYLVELAIASDFSMVTKYGSTTATAAHNAGVMNNVGTNYDDEFAHQIFFVIIENFFSTCATCDPWSNSTAAGTLLDSFRSWGPTGFFATHDLGQLWTNRNFNGGTVGIAYVGAVCTSFRYHCLQDFTSNAASLRVLTSHEIGHNFNCDHDASGTPFIMAPAVNNTNTWSTNSITTVNGYVVTRSCLGSCGPTTVTPVAAFTGMPRTGCAPLTVQFMDQSQNVPTSWAWNFGGGSPASSIQQNPIAVFSNPGSYDITLQATNSAGTGTSTQNGYITVQGPPVANFTFTSTGVFVSFFNTSTQLPTSYTWNFGDGTTSTSANPTKVYTGDGVYQVVLTAINACGSSQSVQFVTVVTPPTAGFNANPRTGCAPTQVQFISTSSANTTGYSWSFPGGSPSTSTQQNPSVTYSTAGAYDVTLQVTNSAGTNSVTETGYITINRRPTAAFNSSANGLQVAFANTSSNNPVSYTWNFGDGSTSTMTSPSHTYTSQGNYTVQLIATNGCGNDTATQVLTLFSPPTASFTLSGNTGCSPLTTTFTSTSSANTSSVEWLFPGGTPATSTSNNPSVVYATAGTYNVSLIAINPVGRDTMRMLNAVTVLASPMPAFSVSAVGATATFTNNSASATSYSWNFGDGNNSTMTSPSHMYAADGVYTVVLSATNNCGTVTTTQTVTIVTPPTASFGASPTTVCENGTVAFNNTSSSNATTYAWTFPGGSPATSSAQNPTVTYSTAGTYNVVLVASNSAGQQTSTQNNFITVNAAPSVAFTANTNGASASFNNTTIGGTTYAWNFGDNSTSTMTSPSHTYSTDGVYTVTLQSTNACGTTSATQQVTIVTPPTASFNATNTTACIGDTIRYRSQASANTTAYAWSFPGGSPSTSSLANPNVFYATTGMYSATLIASNSAGADTMVLSNYITMLGTPTASFTSSVNGYGATFTSTSQGASSFLWTFGDGMTSTSQNPSHLYTTDGTYTVTLQTSNACGTQTSTQTVTIDAIPTAAFTASATSGCAPLVVNFSDASTNNANAWNWSFPGGSPATSSMRNPVVTYATAGTYSVQLIATSAQGADTIVQNNYIQVNTTPTSTFTSARSGRTVNFTHTGSGATSYSWNFGDGGTSTMQNPTHTYTMDGTYQVVHIATNACGSITTTNTITVVTPPTASFAPTVSEGCEPLSVVYSNNSSANAVNFSWSFPGGSPSTSTMATPTVVYNTAGTYAAILIVNNAAGSDTMTMNAAVTVRPLPTTTFTQSTNTSTVTFTNTSVNGTTYLWDFGDGNTSTMTNPSHTYAMDGSYTVTLTSTNACGSTTRTRVIVIATAGPLAAFEANVTEGCAPLTIEFSNLSSDNSESFAWSFPGGTPASSTAENPIVVYNTPGTYSVTLVATNALGNDTYQLVDYITVNAGPTPLFTSSINSNTVTFTNNSTNATSYNWNFGDNNTSTMANPVHTYTASGMYMVVLTATNECGSVQLSQNVNITGALPTASFTTNTEGGCAPLTVPFTNTSTDNVTAWNWVFEGGTPATSSLENPVVVYNTPGIYDVTLEVTNFAGTHQVSAQNIIVVSGPPVADFSSQNLSGNNVQFTNSSTGFGLTYAWDFGDGNTSTMKDPIHTYGDGGEYTVTLTVTNTCGTKTITSVVSIMTSTQETLSLESFSIAPNPSQGVFNVSIEGFNGTVLTLQVYNAIGQRVYQHQVSKLPAQWQHAVQLTNPSAGTYYLVLQSDGKVATRKIVIQ